MERINRGETSYSNKLRVNEGNIVIKLPIFSEKNHQKHKSLIQNFLTCGTETRKPNTNFQTKLLVPKLILMGTTEYSKYEKKN